MNIQEFYDSIDENYENVSSRMMVKNLLRRWIMMRF